MSAVLQNGALVLVSFLISGAIYLSLSGPEWFNRGLGLFLCSVTAVLAALMLYFEVF